MVEPSEPDPRTLREAFHEALRLYRDGWTPGRPEDPMLNIKGKDYTIREVCERMAGIDDRMDDDAGFLVAATIGIGRSADLS